MGRIYKNDLQIGPMYKLNVKFQETEECGEESMRENENWFVTLQILI